DKALARAHINNLLDCPLSVSGYCQELTEFWSAATTTTYKYPDHGVSRSWNQASAIENDRLKNNNFSVPSMPVESGLFGMPEDIEPPDLEILRRHATPELDNLPSGMD